MYKKLFLTAALMTAGLSMNAQTTLAKEFKSTSNGNPISGSVFCADPTALDYKGRLYVYGSNDHQEFLLNGKKGDNSYGTIKSMVVFSTDDMVNWTFHGTIDAATLCAGWHPAQWNRGFMNSWAPSVTWRTHKRSKQDEFFLYFANTSHGVGVLKAKSPLGPWSSPLEEALIYKEIPGALQQSANFDPGVVVDDHGDGWLTFGGLDYDVNGTDLLPGNTRIIKLSAGMVTINGSAIEIPAPYHFEANELNMIGGKYVFTYCTNWASRNSADWNAYKAAHGITASMPGHATMAYMVSDNPTDPNSWVYKGEYGPHTSAPNNHSHLHKFQGNYYHIYHDCSLLESMKNNKAVDSSAGTYRSMCVNKATVNEETATINRVSITSRGVDAIKNLNPYELQQAETMATSGGIEYEDFTNITPQTSINKLGNEASENLQVQMHNGSWVMLRNVDFGTAGATKFTLRAKGTGTLEIRTDRKGATPAATLNFSSSDMSDQTFDVDATKFQGVKAVYLVAASANDFYVDAWQFTSADPSGIQTVEVSRPVQAQTYDLSGRRLSDNHQHRGIVIEQYTDANGVKHSRKRF